MKNIDSNKWFTIDTNDTIGTPEIYQHNLNGLKHAPQIFKDAHGIKVDVRGIIHLIKRCGLNVFNLSIKIYKIDYWNKTQIKGIRLLNSIITLFNYSLPYIVTKIKHYFITNLRYSKKY